MTLQITCNVKCSFIFGKNLKDTNIYKIRHFVGHQFEQNNFSNLEFALPK